MSILSLRVPHWVYNSFAFHITMAQSSLPAPVIVFALWLIVAFKYRALFAPIFVAKAPVTQSNDKVGRLTIARYAA